jgi:hypothetical protein
MHDGASMKITMQAIDRHELAAVCGAAQSPGWGAIANAGNQAASLKSWPTWLRTAVDSNPISAAGVRASAWGVGAGLNIASQAFEAGWGTN